jgi:hypothetical protein
MGVSFGTGTIGVGGAATAMGELLEAIGVVGAATG